MSTVVEPRFTDGRPARRSYVAPQVAYVDLKADEVLVIGCKTLKWGSSKNKSCVITTCGLRDKS